MRAQEAEKQRQEAFMELKKQRALALIAGPIEDAGQLCLALVINEFEGEDGWAYTTTKELARMARLGRTAGYKKLAQMERLGLIEHKNGPVPAALKSYDDQLCSKVSELVLRNRSAGPFGLLNILNDRCGGIFEDIDAVIPLEERNEFMAKYKAAAGFAIEALNNASPTISPGAKVD